MEIYLQTFYNTHYHCTIELSVHGDGGSGVPTCVAVTIVVAN